MRRFVTESIVTLVKGGGGGGDGGGTPGAEVTDVGTRDSSGDSCCCSGCSQMVALNDSGRSYRH